MSPNLLGHHHTRRATTVSDIQRCRGGTEEKTANSGGNIKFGEPRVQMSGPLADMVRERLRRRNEL
ncbi:hypothetical protein J3E72DRAFT_323753 [Bipolaris maydis]|uniref:uncharacterized protein n=1 Tax=Cochliobolus heterostrophus TaxID=5016 RepID=UPI0024DD213B|nr:hypothetical protein J3E73DRAFT_308640 [Bipolaris maydis]KAJ5059519.1 hypothetical protein J3E74DRAFT_348415 [Bipolaris maydis]KAJ6197511.1 hypothetical protein J3E72DRAFT_323753 [Bipolaris maydis]KAJ6209508.1 hypothetical protein PSV09DRAFT_2308188 [Bipolaris maydis]KAJ6271497.1 hypothetical protein PSV08DRAFT_294494 [Bipolaris maydis]